MSTNLASPFSRSLVGLWFAQDPNNMSRISGLIPTLLLLVTALAAAPLYATVVEAVPFDQKVERADAIVLGKVVDSRSELAPDGRFIVTHSTFEVERALKGSMPQRVTVTTPGGRVGSLHQRSIGVPEFRQGDEKLVFLTQTRGGAIVPLFYEQGTYDVERDSRGEIMIRPVSSSAVMIDSQTGLATAAGEAPRSLRAFEASVRRSLGARQMQGVASPDTGQDSPGAFASAREWLGEHGLLVALVMAGIAVASIPLLRRR